MSSRRLLVSVHDVSPRFERQVDTLVAAIERHTGAARFAMLVVPNHWGDAPLLRGSAFATRLRGWSDAGVEMFVHGWFHRDEARHEGALDRARGSLMTAGEGEFLGLDTAEAARRMADGKALVEDVTGRAAAGFIAPAWLYGEGARAALAQAEFALAEDHLRVWQADSGAVVARGPVITWASRSRMRTASSLAVAGVARYALAGAATVRVAVHPGDTSKASIMASIDATLKRLSRTHRAGRYADLPGA